MRKLNLCLDDLAVTSFATEPEHAPRRGTVNGNMSLVGPPPPPPPPPPPEWRTNTEFRVSDACLPYTQNKLDTNRVD